MKEIDYSKVDPLRIPEAQRRVAAIQDYLELDSPTGKDVTRCATAVHLSSLQFSRLVRVWRDHRRPDLLVVGARGPSGRNYGISARAAAIASEVISNADLTSKMVTIAIEIECKCAAEKVPPPSRPTIWTYIRKARAESIQPVSGPPRVVIGRMWFHLPVEGLTKGGMPTLTAAILLPERMIIAYRISLDADAPASVEDLVADLITRRTVGAPTRPLLMDAADRRVADPVLVAEGLQRIRSHTLSIPKELARAFGGRLGRLPAIYQRGLARPKRKRVIQRQDSPLEPKLATATIQEAINANNATVTLPLTSFDISEK